MNIMCNDLTLFSQGTLICKDPHKIEFELEEGVFVQFKFKTTQEEEKKVESHVVDGRLEVVFYNFNNPLGTAVASMSVGKIGKTQYILSASVYSVGENGSSIKTVHYNWYKKEIA